MKIRCSGCKAFKSTKNFYKNSHRKSGFTNYCKKCCATNHRKAYRKNRKKRIKQTVLYRKNNSKRLKLADKLWRKKNKKRNRKVERNGRLLRLFGINSERYGELLKEQNGVCKICLEAEKHTRNNIIQNLSVDHCHKTGAVRGLLCKQCNTGIGLLKDSVNILKSAILYLEANNDYRDKGQAA